MVQQPLSHLSNIRRIVSTTDILFGTCQQMLTENLKWGKLLRELDTESKERLQIWFYRLKYRWNQCVEDFEVLNVQ